MLNLFFGLLTDTHAHIAHMQLKHKSTVSVRPSTPVQSKNDPLPPCKEGPFLSIEDPVSQSTSCPPLPKTSFFSPFQKGSTVHTLSKGNHKSQKRGRSNLQKGTLQKGSPPFPEWTLYSKSRLSLLQKGQKDPPPPPAPTSRWHLRQHENHFLWFPMRRHKKLRAFKPDTIGGRGGGPHLVAANQPGKPSTRRQATCGHCNTVKKKKIRFRNVIELEIIMTNNFSKI